MDATHLKLKKQNQLLLNENRLLREAMQKLLDRIAELEAQLNKSSKNSSQPPSADRKPNVPPPTKKEDRPYHSGACRQLLPEGSVTSREARHVEQCPRCRSKMELLDDVVKWQQIECPPIKPLVHQIELIKSKCPCCHLETRPGLSESEQFLLDPRMEGFLHLLLGQYRQGHRTVREIVAAIFPEVVLSQGLISKVKARGVAAFEEPYAELREAIRKSHRPKQMDATGWRHAGSNEHAMVLRVDDLIAYDLIENQRSQTVADLVGRKITRLVCDRGLPCGEIDVTIKQYCLAHLLRNVRGQAEHPATNCSDTEKLGEIYDILQEFFIDKRRVDRGEISQSTMKGYGYQKCQYLKEKIGVLAEKGSTKKLRRFCSRLQRDLRDFFSYLRDPALPMTNNPAEEALRNLVIARKLCFGSRSRYGKQWRAFLQSCTETLRRQGRSVLDFLTEAIQSVRFRRGAPSVLPV